MLPSLSLVMLSPTIRALSVWVVAAAVCLPLAAESRDVFAFVQTHCAACHNGTVKSGDVDLSVLKTAKTFEDDREIWEKVEREILPLPIWLPIEEKGRARNR